MVIKWPLSLPIVIAATACLCPAQSLENTAIEREEYIVYSAMIPEEYAEFESRFMLITNPTSLWAHQIAKKDFQFRYPAPVISQKNSSNFDWFGRRKCKRQTGSHGTSDAQDNRLHRD